MRLDAKIFVAGHKGLVGSAIVRRLKKDGYDNIITRAHVELDLENYQTVNNFFKQEKPEYVFLAAAKVGGILANNNYPADFIFKNLMIQNHVIHNCYLHSIKKMIFLGSSCIYPRLCKQPMKEEFLMTGSLEPTNSPYAIAKIAGIEMCWSYNRQYGTQFIPVMPTNLYGLNDNFDLESSHVLPALIRKFHEAKESNAESVNVWGTGLPRREFLYVDDMADACIYVMNNYSKFVNDSNKPLYNIGTGVDITIKELVKLIKEIIGFSGEILWDNSKLDGAPKKLLDVSSINALGWKAETKLKDGIRKTIKWYINRD